jgi:hypothetical protein
MVAFPYRFIASVLERIGTGDSKRKWKANNWQQTLKRAFKQWERFELWDDGTIRQTYQMEPIENSPTLAAIQGSGGVAQDRFAKEKGIFPHGGSLLLLGFVKTEPRVIGYYRLLTAEEGRAEFSDEAFLKASNDCPFTGEVLGFLNFEFLSSTELQQAGSLNNKEWFLVPIQKECRGILARVDTSYFRSILCCQEFSLDNITSKWGFNDGDFFISNGPCYSEAVITEIQKILEGEGLRGEVYFCSSSHNTVRLTGPLYQAGEEVDPYSILSRLAIKIWGYDEQILQDPQLGILQS